MNRKILLSFLALCLFLTSVEMTIAVSVDIPTTIDSRIKTIVYNPNEVIELTFHYGFQSFIEFEEDEDIEIISLGESFPWKVTPVGKRMFIRPMQINTNTNMTVITTKRTYMFQLRADSYENKGDEELIYSVRFFYPDGSNKIPAMTGSKYSNVKNLGDKSQDEINSVLDNFKRGTVLNFDYSMTTNRNKSIKILRVFDDGISTYFEFENKNIIPNIYSVDLNGKETQIKYFIDGPYVVVNMVQLQFSLRVTDNIVCIFNNSMLY
ncbi:MAG: P-type conjugative transfer protein VirB9 [Rickettsiales bacterium]|nr:P-type conjugative transfer protein VirB9 [Rickettsiales bacterium]